MANSKSWLRFDIGNLLLVITLVALALGWWSDRRRLQSEIELLQLRLDALKPRSGGGGFFGGMGNGAPVDIRYFDSPSELVAAVEAVFKSEIDFDSRLVESILLSKHLDAAAPGLVELLRHEDPVMRRQIAEILVRQNQPPQIVVSGLIERLDDKDVVVQRRAVEGLVRFRAKSALPDLRRKMLDDDCPIASYVAKVITALDSDADIGPRLIELTRNKQRDNRLEAIVELPNYVDGATAKRVLTQAFSATESKDREMRQAIAQSINRLVMTDEK
jgi:HEAT repeat protein